AIQKAERRARKNLVYVDRFESRTLFGDIDYKFQNTRLMLAPKAAGYGLSVNHVISEICTLCGINDLAGKVMGSTNRMNVVKATFAAFTYQKHPQTLARQRGKKVADVSMRYFGRTGTDVPHRAHLL
ncbi:ribosomal protein S5 domain 2-like protein, partial [Caulochytrium protostelioides]